MLSALAHLSPDDRLAFISKGVGPSRPIPWPVVHHAFEYHVQTQPHLLAVEHTSLGHTLTYEQLDRSANRLARRLRARGICPGHRVCILARRSIYLIVAIVAVLKSGAQYVPVDAVTVTDFTLDYILRDSTPSVVLSMQEYTHRVSSSPSPTLCLEDVIEADEQADVDATKPLDLSSPHHGVYVIYTSGTTGVPKGVDVRHDGVSNVISGSPGNVGMRPGMRVAQLLNIAFDMGAWEILSSLYNGCTICLRGDTSKEWAMLMKSVDIVICTPSILARHDPTDYPNLKHVIVGGEVCSQALADKWAACTQFNNCCGPTEISICNTIQAHTPGYPLSIGTPIPNTNVYILSPDPTSTLALPIGQVGCMWVGGIGVSNGYLNLPEKTAERWRRDPFLDDGSMMFDTGDLARWRADGQLEHHGRADDQVKIKGFRVELDGVASAMRTHDSVREAVALLVGTELWGFVTPSSVDLGCVRLATAKVQPYYAVPSQFLALHEFPMTRNGKIDKRALAELAAGGSSMATVSLSIHSHFPHSHEYPQVPQSPPPAPLPMWRRLSVQSDGGGNGSLPDTPIFMTEQATSQWALSTTSGQDSLLMAASSEQQPPPPSTSSPPSTHLVTNHRHLSHPAYKQWMFSVSAQS